jgi:hypothetical protein
METEKVSTIIRENRYKCIEKITDSAVIETNLSAFTMS